MTAPLRVALIAPLSEPLTRRATSEPVVLAWELATCLFELQTATSSLELTVIARRDSERIAPTITLDPEELEHERRFGEVSEESLLVEFVLRGGLDGYDVVHLVGPYLAPVQLLTRGSQLVFQTDWTNGGHAAHGLATKIIGTPRFQRIRIVGLPSTRLDVIRAPIDLTANPLAATAGRAIACLPQDAEQARVAQRIAAALGRPLVTPLETAPDRLLDDAGVLLSLATDPAPIGELWPLRAAARGVLVACWIGGPVETARWPVNTYASAPYGDVDALVADVRRRVALEPHERAARRTHVLTQHGPRSVAARYVEAYRVLRQQLQQIAAS